MAQPAAKPLHADRVVVLKKERTLQLLTQGKVIKTYKVALGADPIGPKTRQGDHKTPEGNYVLDSRNPHSQFYKSIHISYPNADDRAVARVEILDLLKRGGMVVSSGPNTVDPRLTLPKKTASAKASNA